MSKTKFRLTEVYEASIDTGALTPAEFIAAATIGSEEGYPHPLNGVVDLLWENGKRAELRIEEVTDDD